MSLKTSFNGYLYHDYTMIAFTEVFGNEVFGNIFILTNCWSYVYDLDIFFPLHRSAGSSLCLQYLKMLPQTDLFLVCECVSLETQLINYLLSVFSILSFWPFLLMPIFLVQFPNWLSFYLLFSISCSLSLFFFFAKFLSFIFQAFYWKFSFLLS